MAFEDKPVRAYVCDVDPVRDLALLKLADPPAQPLAHVTLAGTAARPGDFCAIIGHPSSGMLWTFRSGQVAAVGNWPHDRANQVMQRLHLSGAQAEQFDAALRRIPPQKILLISCLANPGDSGSPIVNEQGEVIAVEFAGPAELQDKSFSYCVDLSEVRAFLDGATKQPRLLLPDPWRFGPFVEFRDTRGKGKPQVLVSGAEKPEAVLFDLDADTPQEYFDRQDLEALVGQHKFDAEVALHLSKSKRTAFYDRDNDGSFDLILVDDDPDPFADTRYTRDPDGRWTVEHDLGEVEWLSPSYLNDRVLGKVLMLLVKEMP
jgi:hypothetical protein